MLKYSEYYDPTTEELDRLMRYRGRKLTINVHVKEVIWDYGDAEHNEYDVSYSMKLTVVSLDKIIGTILEDTTNQGERGWHYKGRVMNQPFSLYWGGEISGKEGPVSKAITLIQHNNKILYDRRE